MRLLLFITALALLPTVAEAQPVYVDSKAGETATGPTVSTASLTVGSLTNGYLACGIATDGFDSVPTVSSVTFSGTALTFKDSSEYFSAGGIGARVEFWDMVAPPAASAVITATLSSSVPAAIGCVLYSSVDQATPFGTVTKNGNRTGYAQAVVDSSATQTVIDMAGVFMISGTATSSQTQRVQQLSSGSNAPAILMASAAGATTVTMSWHMDDDNNRSWAMIGIPLIYNAGGGGTTAKRTMTLGVGEPY